MVRRLTFAARQSVLRNLRAEVRKIALALGADERVGDNLALVVDELVNNAIEHGADYRRAGLDLALQFQVVGTRLQIEFFDPEMPVDAVQDLARLVGQATDGMPSLDSERGRGLFLLSVYLQDLQAGSAPAGGLRLGGYIDRK
ncbi:MAG: ATP-binding protein [Planctomycetota bacterium]